MARIARLRVHVACVGYEVDRIVMPARQERADKVCLMLHDNRSEDKAVPFIRQIRQKLEGLGIDVEEEYHDRRDLFDIIRTVRGVIGREGGNEIYVNLASGSKIQAIGTMMACMMFNEDENVHPFYVEAAVYPGFSSKKPLSTGVRDIQDMPLYSIKTPGPKLVSALHILEKRGGRMTKKEMAGLAEEEGLITVNAMDKNHSMARFASLDKNIIRPLEEQWRFVETEKVGRNRWIRFTEDGRNAIRFL